MGKTCYGCYVKGGAKGRKPTMKIRFRGGARDVCSRCCRSLVALNVDAAGESIYRTLKFALENADHDQECSLYDMEPDPDTRCSCWYGKVRKALWRAEGRVKESQK